MAIIETWGAETGDITEIDFYDADAGTSITASTEQAHGGTYSFKGSITTNGNEVRAYYAINEARPDGHHPAEIQEMFTVFYIYFPDTNPAITNSTEYCTITNWKSEVDVGGGSESVWSLGVEDDASDSSKLNFVLTWGPSGSWQTVETGPGSGEGPGKVTYHDTTEFSKNTWLKVKTAYKSNSAYEAFDGRVRVWVNDNFLFDKNNVATGWTSTWYDQGSYEQGDASYNTLFQPMLFGTDAGASAGAPMELYFDDFTFYDADPDPASSERKGSVFSLRY